MVVRSRHRDDGRLEEEEPEENGGNFRGLLHLLLHHGNDVLNEHIKSAPANATYLSKTIQNGILECARAVIQDSIRRTVGERFYSLLADETTDRAGREQLVIVLRYAIRQDGSWCLREDPVLVVDLLSEIKKQKRDDRRGGRGEDDGRKHRWRHIVDQRATWRQQR